MKQVKIGNKIIEIIDNDIVTHRIANNGSPETLAILDDINAKPEEFSVETVDSDKDMSDLVDDEKGVNARKSLFE